MHQFTAKVFNFVVDKTSVFSKVKTRVETLSLNRQKMAKDCLFVSDLHGKVNRYEKLFRHLEEEPPAALFMGGDLLPASILHSFRAGENMPDFVSDYLADKFMRLKEKLKDNYPRVFIIMGNDDPKIEEQALLEHEKKGLWEYVQGRFVSFGAYRVFGYAYVPPTPFLLKDWERFDIHQETKPGCIPPTEGFRTQNSNTVNQTIEDDLQNLLLNQDLSKTICMFHSPPYQTVLDRAGLDGVSVDEQIIDVHVGSVAIKNLINKKKPYMTLHGHIHESSRLTGKWTEKINKTTAISAAWEGPGLAVVKFRVDQPDHAERVIL